ncbi:MAG: asparagine synthase (glutamine-hydrolyzing) [Bdellovibrionales bacterium]
MCGIAGFVNLTGRLDAEKMLRIVSRMTQSLSHRGPDDSGTWVDTKGRIALGHRRLSVIDLSPAGHQPMRLPTGDALILNGEIYNFLELRKKLENKGAFFHSSSDTEVLLNGLALEEEKFISELDAMFAFAWYNEKKRKLVLARDAFGEKPLYYIATTDHFAFASELQALTHVPGFDASIDTHRIASYLALQYLPAPLTIYKTVKKLLPGHFLRLGAEGDVHIEKYFNFSASASFSALRSLNDLADELEEILDRTIKTRMLADVPLGAFLSGGVDSSTVVAMARKHSSRPIKTFSIGFFDSADSEHENARAMASHLKTEHHDDILNLNTLRLGQHIATVIDEPNGDTSCLPTWALSQLARQSVTVALSGDGGDEFFGGYGRYLTTLDEEHKRGGDPSWDPAAAYYSNRILVFADQTLEKFIGPLPEDTKALLANMRQPLRSTDKPLLQRLRKTDIENYLPGAVLSKVDRISMQHALEVRAPLLGRQVADFAMRMASEDLCTPSFSKRVLKQLAARYIPREWLDRPKMGFGLPVKGWGGKELAGEVHSLLTDTKCRLSEWIDKNRLLRFSQFHNETPVTYQLWAVYILELWLRTHPSRAA